MLLMKASRMDFFNGKKIINDIIVPMDSNIFYMKPFYTKLFEQPI